MAKHIDPEKAKLTPLEEFEVAMKKVLKVTKKESDEQLARFQASNKARREEKKPKD
ncbi:MAG TPA: hypothetical protein VJB57_03140 [Dehalococcoidia bacterium]|nr:hypothetical protein [Dehalococcoidia bacterium]